MTEMTSEIAVSPVLASLPEAPPADSDSQLLEIWLHGRSRHTQRAYRADVEHFLSSTGKPFLQVTLADLQGFADSLGELAPASRYRTLSSIKSLLSFAHRTGYLPYDVGRALRLPAVRSRLAERILPEAELHRVLSLETNPRNRAILTLLYASGMRVSELCGLCWRDLQPNSDGGQVTVLGKPGNRARKGDVLPLVIADRLLNAERIFGKCRADTRQKLKQSHGIEIHRQIQRRSDRLHDNEMLLLHADPDRNNLDRAAVERHRMNLLGDQIHRVAGFVTVANRVPQRHAQ